MAPAHSEAQQSVDADVAIRPAADGDLHALLELLRHLNPGDAPLPAEAAVRAIWGSILDDPKVHCLVVEVDDVLVASSILAIIPNLTRGARPYGLVENVVTHADYRKRGIGTGLLRHALKLAFTAGCHKVMLSTSRKGEAVVRF